MPSAVLKSNLIDENTVITSSSEDADWPLNNLYDQIAAKVFKWTSAAAGSSISVKADNSNPPTTVVATPSSVAGSIWADLGASVNARYIRLEVDAHWVQFDLGTSETPDTLAIINHNFGSGDAGQMGQVVIYTRTVLPRSSRFGKVPGRTRADIFHETQGGVAYVSNLYTQEIREYTWRVTESELATFEGVDDVILGRLLPYVFIPDTAATEVLYVRNLDPDYRPKELTAPMEESGYDLEVKIRQESFGIQLDS